jgi:hypothetical protein
MTSPGSYFRVDNQDALLAALKEEGVEIDPKR